jgi:3-oxoacyl-[acyl-carrier-protein] synthase II
MAGAATPRAVVTGIGVLSPLGLDRAAFADGVVEGRSGIGRIEAFDTTPFRTPFGGEVVGFDPTEHLDQEELDLFPDRYLRLGLAAARQALSDSGLDWSRRSPAPPRAALVVGTCNGGLESAQIQYEMLAGQIPRDFNRRVNLLIRYHTLGKALTYGLGVSGPAWIVTTACSASTAALGLALELITHRVADVVLTGGTDALCLATMAGFDALKATSTERIAPFSTPTGLNLGEGAAFWVVEEAERARARGARVTGEILGYAFTSDAHHPTAPDPRGDGAVRTIATALERAGVAVDELGCFNLHGTGTEANDRTESRAVARFLGDGRDVPAHSFKSQVGHCLGAAGILEASAGLVAMGRGVIPATINFDEPRPGCALDYVGNRPRAAEYGRFISCNYAFGGHNAGVVIGDGSPTRSPAAGPVETARIVLTGGGSLNALGVGVESLLEGLRRGRRGLSSIDGHVHRPTTSQLAGYVPDFKDRDVDRRLDTRQMNPISRYATVAARLALADAGIRVGPREGLGTGIINGVYVGPSEEGHMTAVVGSGGAEADIAGFSSIVANATAGWVSNALVLKGYTCTVSQGADAGLFALLFAHLALRSGFGPRILAGAADELYSRYFINYDELGLLCSGRDEEQYRLLSAVDRRRVLGEGAAYVVAEEREQAIERGASILAEVVGFGQTTDTAGFYEPNLDPAGLTAAVGAALGSAGWDAKDVGLVIWSPQGNSADLKQVEALRSALGEPSRSLPLVTSVFNTGLCEAVSGTATLTAVLKAWSDGGGLWPQMTGVKEIDGSQLPAEPVPTLAIASSELGFNLALAIAPGSGGAS